MDKIFQTQPTRILCENITAAGITPDVSIGDRPLDRLHVFFSVSNITDLVVIRARIQGVFYRFFTFDPTVHGGSIDECFSLMAPPADFLNVNKFNAVGTINYIKFVEVYNLAQSSPQ